MNPHEAVLYKPLMAPGHRWAAQSKTTMQLCSTSESIAEFPVSAVSSATLGACLAPYNTTIAGRLASSLRGRCEFCNLATITAFCDATSILLLPSHPTAMRGETSPPPAVHSFSLGHEMLHHLMSAGLGGASEQKRGVRGEQRDGKHNAYAHDLAEDRTLSVARPLYRVACTLPACSGVRN